MADQYVAQNGKLYVAVSGVVPNSMVDMPDISVSDNTAKISISAYTWLLDNVTQVGAVATGIAVGSGTISAAKYATIRLEISEAGTVTAGTKCASKTTLAQAVAALPDVGANKMSMGYYAVKSATATLTTLGTTKLSTAAAAGATALITFYTEFDRSYVADFQGNVSMTNAVETIDWKGQDIVPSGSAAIGMTTELNISEMAFRPDSLRKLWGATHSTTASLKGKSDGDAYSWTVTADLRPVTLQLLFHFTNSETGKQEQIYCPAGKAMQIPMTFGNKTWVIHDMGWKLFIDSNRRFFYYFMEK